MKKLTTLVSIDPGKATGIAIGVFGDDHPYELLETHLVPNGIGGVIHWFDEVFAFTNPDILNNELLFVSEQFVARSNNKFVADTEPLLIEGALTAIIRDEIVWQLRTDKALVDDRILKTNGLWQTGKTHEWVDGRDVNDAIIHALAYLKKAKHIPTLNKYWKPSEDTCGND